MQVRTPTTDIRLDSEGDLDIANGDFVLHHSEQQHIEHILASHKGNWREHPICGVSIAHWLNAPFGILERHSLERKIHAQLTFDGLGQIRIALQSADNISIEAKRKK